VDYVGICPGGLNERGKNDIERGELSAEKDRSATRALTLVDQVPPIALVLGLLGGGLGATLDALPAAASTVSGVLFSGSSHIAGETGHHLDGCVHGHHRRAQRWLYHGHVPLGV